MKNIEGTIIGIMFTLHDENCEELLELKKSSMTDLKAAKELVQSWWMNIPTPILKMRILFIFDSELQISKIKELDLSARKTIAGILIIKQKEEDYLPE